MKENNFSQQNIKSKEFLNFRNKIFIGIVLLVEVGLMFGEAYFFALEKVAGGWQSFGSIPFFLASIPVSILGIIFGTVFLVRKKFSLFPIILIFVSIVASPFFDSSFVRSVVAPILVPVARVENDKELQQARADFSAAQKSLYEKLSNKFQNPQKVLAVDEQYSVLVLQDGSVVQLYQIMSYRQKDFIAWAKINLLNQNVKFALPSPEYNLYDNLHLMSCDKGYESGVISIRKKYGLSDYEGGVCSFIPVNIIWNGELVNDKYNK